MIFLGYIQAEKSVRFCYLYSKPSFSQNIDWIFKKIITVYKRNNKHKLKKRKKDYLNLTR